MLKHFRLGLLMCLLGGLALQACALSVNQSSPTATSVAATPSNAESTVAATQTNTAAPSSTPTPLLTPLATVTIVASAGTNATVTSDSLCWLGPGPGFEVSSAVLAGARVTLIGRGNIGSWWIIQNPIYHDACWMHQQDLQVDSGVDLSALAVYTAPPSPTPTPTSTGTPKPTITPSPTP